MMNLKENFEKDIKRVQTRKEKGKEKVLNPEAKVFRRSKLLGKYMAKILFEWNDGNFENEYLKKLEKSWIRWKEKRKQVFLEMEFLKRSTVIVCLDANILFGFYFSFI